MAWKEPSRASLAAIAALALGLLACRSSPPPQEPHHDEPVIETPEPEPTPEPAHEVDPPQGAGQQPVSKASYDEALAEPEPLDPGDGRAHLTDLQLTNPMRDAIARCRAPKSAKILIKVAVQMGRAIGVTVRVTFDPPISASRPRGRAAAAAAAAAARRQAKWQAKASAKISACVDHGVRALNWPPSPRRDSFTTEF